MFENADLIHAYTRADALDDGTLIDGRRAELAEVTEQHAPGVPVAMTDAVWTLAGINGLLNAGHLALSNEYAPLGGTVTAKAAGLTGVSPANALARRGAPRC